jgi:hypothetical protein
VVKKGEVRSEVITRLGNLTLKLSEGEEAIVEPVLGKFRWSQVCFSGSDIAEAVYRALPLSAEEPPQVRVQIRPRRGLWAS